MRGLVIAPLDAAIRDRAGFDSGVAQVDNFFRLTARKLERADNLRTFVMTAEAGDVIGFYAVNAHAVGYSELPPRYARARPRHGAVPAAYIAMIGVDRRFQGRGYGGDLLADCLKRVARAADLIGIAVVMLDVLDCGDPAQVARRLALYVDYGFAPLGSNPLRLYLPIAAARVFFAAG